MPLYTIKKSRRAKNVRITVHPDETVTVTVPYRMNIEKAEAFVQEKKGWIDRMLDRLRHLPKPARTLSKGGKLHYSEHRSAALRLVEDRLEHYNQFYCTSWNRVTIKNTATRWGSCSCLRNLNFSYRVLFLPDHLRDYLVVHELCHLIEMNHSARFWRLVEKTIPDYASCRQELRDKP